MDNGHMIASLMKFRIVNRVMFAVVMSVWSGFQLLLMRADSWFFVMMPLTFFFVLWVSGLIDRKTDRMLMK